MSEELIKGSQKTEAEHPRPRFPWVCSPLGVALVLGRRLRYVAGVVDRSGRGPTNLPLQSKYFVEFGPKSYSTSVGSLRLKTGG